MYSIVMVNIVVIAMLISTVAENPLSFTNFPSQIWDHKNHYNKKES